MSTARMEQFSGYMRSVTTSEGVDVKHLITGYGWANLGDATVVDVGGSTGYASIALAREFPNLRFVVQDLNTNNEGGRKGILQEDIEIQSRVSFQVHDFFNPQPINGADVYLLRMILHSWSDREAQSIISHILPAMQTGARLLIMDSVLPLPGAVASTRGSLLRVRDLTMMMTFNSKERAAEDWASLLQETDARLKIVRMQQPVGSLMTVMEVMLDGN
ncbi:hypothetical protein H112_06207 [Trichophyton rubrum D6]|uniref:O-methyltransferase C-terminal domain-containing protein n=3 Tax=Trichophyton TaxID=5550 RepID=F2SGU6_TRIRC|nr:uncharacterized protein TERG_01582 [Trichophyton rubrum CBS 118892]EZF13841.1 hypothetical protein H100_06222 [Trichophyton rubrum MR850]EZF39574.1 hypothetical protein H102_06189 [Trichophyton rubrum CBS 100081]EZF50098.1 hypothetical protein H103_06214 [Trichophyton rubrum CBS 288.86]EZF60730.1 hypothetical protein H104_06201 [Trichophyton rubrum CBS 289.86]EZF71567.1 hypothetical protein H105_06228 [Trichophyton soudanense CBS 452.61]EZF82057.1 hypothetical protein H110_06210 [Trichophy